MKKLIATSLMFFVALTLIAKGANAQDSQRGIEAQQSQRLLVVDPSFNQGPTLGVTGRIISNYGFIVESVSRFSLAQEMGLERGDIIVKAGGRRVDSIRTLRRAMSDAQFSWSGQVSLLVDNVRARNGIGGQRFVQVQGTVPRSGSAATVRAQRTDKPGQ